MNYRQKRLAVLRSELKDVGVKWSQAKNVNKFDKRILFVIGKLLINYPVSFNLDFIREAIDMSLGTHTRSKYLISAYSTYYEEINKEKRA